MARGETSVERSSFRLASLIMGLFFSYAAYVQLNDPDWPPWVLVYGAAATLSYLKAFIRFTPFMLPAVCFVLVTSITVLIFISLHNFWRSNGGFWAIFDVNTELGREALGASIVAGWMVIMCFPEIKARNVRSSYERKARSLQGEVGDIEGFGLATLTLAAIVLASAWAVPKFLIDPQKLESDKHCYGLGVKP